MTEMVPLDDLSSLQDLLARNVNPDGNWVGEESDIWKLHGRSGDLFCTICSRRARMALKAPARLHSQNFDLAKRASRHPAGPTYAQWIAQRRFIPSLVEMTCLQCGTPNLGVLFLSNGSPSLAIVPETFGGTATPHTPAQVAYYLNQAQRAHAIGANSAAIAMYRSALEHLLHHQGFKDGMLGKQLADLDAAMAKGTAPTWVAEFQTEHLNLIKKLGNQAIHANDGDIGLQDGIDADLLRIVSQVFAELLDVIYEEPARIAARLERLNKALKKP